MEEKKWFSCHARQERDVQVYLEAASLEEARARLEKGEWDDMDILDEEDDGDGVSGFKMDTLTEVPVSEGDDDDDDDDGDD